MIIFFRRFNNSEKMMPTLVVLAAGLGTTKQNWDADFVIQTKELTLNVQTYKKGVWRN